MLSPPGPVLAPMFADPSIVKVLHGSDSDIAWLQRDFGIYVVNMFDTGQAARVLALPGCGLGYLLDKYCGFKVSGCTALAASASFLASAREFCLTCFLFLALDSL